MGQFVYSTTIWGQDRPTWEDDDITDIFSELGQLKMNVHNKVIELTEFLNSLKQDHAELKKRIMELDKPMMSSEEHEVFYELMKKELDLLAKIECIQDVLFSLYDIKDNLAFERKY